MAIKASSQISIVDVSDGVDGKTGKGVASVTPEYYLSASKTTQTGGSWSTTPPNWSSGKYLWVRQIVTYTDSSVSRTQPYCDTSWEAVNNVQVGGRNLLVGTSKGFSLNADVPSSFVISSPQYTSQDIYYTTSRMTFKDMGYSVGDEITISFDWSLSKYNDKKLVYGNFRIEAYGTKDGAANTYLTYIKAPVATFSASNMKGHAIITHKLTSTTLLMYRLMWRIDNTVGTFSVSNVKLEKGNKATDWTPAPEDVEVDATKKANAAAKTATNYMKFQNNGLVIGNMTAGTLGKNVLIDNDSVDIRNGNTVLASYGTKTTIGATTGRHVLIDNDSVDIRKGNTVLASYGDDVIYLGKNNKNATINLCNSLGKIYNYKGHLAIESTDIYIDSSIYPHAAHISLNATKDGEKLVIGAEKTDGSANVNGSIIEVRSNKIDIGTYYIHPSEPGVKDFYSRIYSEYGKGTTITGNTTISGTLVLSKTTDASGTANKSPALIVGGTDTTEHIEIDSNEILAKSNGTTPSGLSLNSNGGTVYIGSGGIKTPGNVIGICQIVKMGSSKTTIPYQSGRTKALIEFWKTSIAGSDIGNASQTIYDSAYVTGLSNKMNAVNGVTINAGPDFAFVYSISADGKISVTGTFSKYRITYFN